MAGLDDLQLRRVERELVQAIEATESLLGPEELAALDRRRQQPHSRFPGKTPLVYAPVVRTANKAGWATAVGPERTDPVDPSLPGPNYGRLPARGENDHERHEVEHRSEEGSGEASLKAEATRMMAALHKEYEAADVNGDGVLQPLEMIGLLTKVGHTTH